MQKCKGSSLENSLNMDSLIIIDLANTQFLPV